MFKVSTHSRLKAAGFEPTVRVSSVIKVSTHSRLKAAGSRWTTEATPSTGFNTQPPEGGWSLLAGYPLVADDVSTHSRLKAAGLFSKLWLWSCFGFNTQPPEGGWTCMVRGIWSWMMFQHTAA